MGRVEPKPGSCHTEALTATSRALVDSAGVRTALIQAVDHEIAPGVQPDVIEHGAARVHAADCASCETTAGQLDRITRPVHLVGELDDDQRARLLAVADKCLVRRTLHSEVIVDTVAS